jgi:plasmid stability protein
MVSITIRNVPEDTRNELAARAARSGRSLQEYVRLKLIELTDKPDIETWLAQVRAHQATHDTNLTDEQILAARDADRR